MRRCAAALAAVFALVVLAPVAHAALGAPDGVGDDADARVTLAWTDGAWNGASEARIPPGADSVRVWVPGAARIQAVQTVAGDGDVVAPTGWRAAGADALVVDAPPNATRVVVRFDMPAGALSGVAYRAPAPVAALAILVAPPDGRAPRSPASEFEALGDGWHLAEARALGAGDTVSIRVVDAGRVGELPVVATVAAIALAVLLLGLAWHRARPPLEGRTATRFLDHLVELQARLVPPAIAFGVLNVLFFVAGLRATRLYGVPLVAPTWGPEASLASRAFDAFAESLVPAGVSLVVLRPVDAILAQVQVTLFLAFVATLPLLLYELAAFIGPALVARERRATMRVIPLVLGLFLVGAVLGYRVMAPLMIRTLYDFAPGLGATPLLVVGDLVSFALVIVLAFGLAFELPVVMYVLSRLGLVRAATFRRYFRHAVVAIFLVAGVITPDPSVVSQLLVAVPVTLLYATGLLTATLGEGRRDGGARAGADAA